MQMFHVENGKLNLGLLREAYRNEISSILNEIPGNKAIFWDESLTAPFDFIADFSFLKEHGVEKMYLLTAGKYPSTASENLIFIIRPKLNIVDLAAQIISKINGPNNFSDKNFHVIFVPRRSLHCEKRLKELEVYNSIKSMGDYGLDIFPIDYDLLSMELPLAYRQCYLEGDPSALFQVAKALMSVQYLYGFIPKIFGKGDCASRVIEMLQRMKLESNQENISCVVPQIDNLIILDREVDPLTPLLIQLTYEGLIDELFGINHCIVKLPADKFKTNETKSQVANNENQSLAPSSSSKLSGQEIKKIALNSCCELFADLRDRNFNAVGAELSRRVKLITAEYDTRHAAKTVSAMKIFVSKLTHMHATKTSLGIHTTIAEMIKDIIITDEFRKNLSEQQDYLEGQDLDKAQSHIEELIAKGEPINKVLRLICIQCHCNSGFKPKLMDYYKKEIIQAYGYQHLITLNNLEKVGLLRLQQGVTRTYPIIKKAFKLLSKEVDELNPVDISYTYSGYAPLLVRLVQYLNRPGWKGSANEVMDLLPGKTTEVTQQIPGWLRTRHNSGDSSFSNLHGSEQKLTLVFVIGGLTFAEIASFKFLSQVEDIHSDFIIGTTKFINANTWLESISDTLKPIPANPF